MNIQITGIHCDTSKELKRHISEKMNTLNKFYEKITNTSVTVEYVGEHKRKIDLNVSIPHKVIHATSYEDSMSLAINEAYDKIVRQLKRENEKLKTH